MKQIRLVYRLCQSLVVLALVVGCAPIPPAPVQPAASEPAADAMAAPAADVVADDLAHTLPDQLGTVDFPVSCTEEAQAEFNRGVALLHSFWFSMAVRSFKVVNRLDPTCAMAHWGVAMSMLGIPWSPTPEAALLDGQMAVDAAVALGGETAREQAYIDAIAAFYQDFETLDHGTRAQSYEKAMAQLVGDHPEDTEAQAFYALSLLITASPGDKSYANQVQAQELLEPLFQAQPNHPGAAHYLIHSNDYPPLAAGGLDAAYAYAPIAPAAPHVQHMPSHIFTRLGSWQESIDSNRASLEAVKAELPADYPSNHMVNAAMHASDYMMYGYLQLAQDDAAKALLDEIAAIEQAEGSFGSAYALAAIPARYALERGAWEDTADLTLHPASFPWERFPQAEAIVNFARGLGAARAGNVEMARAELTQLQTLHETLVEANNGYWADQVEIQSRMIEAWVALAEEQPDEALALMQEAVALEELTEKHPVTPGLVKPTYELLGEMLLELDRPAEALDAFETLLVDDPRRYRGIFGAAHAAELAGDMTKAKSYYSELMDLVATGDGQRAEIEHAQAFLAGR